MALLPLSPDAPLLTPDSPLLFPDGYVGGGATLTSPSTGPGDRLGCGVWKASLLARGGGAALAVDAAYQQAACAWEWSTTSKASAELHDPVACAKLVPYLRAWKHELALYRDDTLAWVGPVVGLSYDGARLNVQAQDISAWLARRFLHNDLTAVAMDAAQLAALIIADAIAPDNSMGLVVAWGAIGVNVTRSYLASDYNLASSLLADLKKIGAYWRVEGRTIYVGSAIPTGNVGNLAGDSWAGVPTIQEDGMIFASRYVIQGAQPATTAGQVSSTLRPTGETSSGVAEFGLVESTLQDDRILTPSDATVRSAQAIQGATFAPRLISAGDLAAAAPIRFANLRPGRIVHAVTTGADATDYYLSNTSVSSSAASGERVTVSLTKSLAGEDN